MSGTLLLVEDNEDDVFAFKRSIRKAQIAHPIQVATDGRRAVAYLEGSGDFADRSVYPRPSLVFLDLKLPYMSGLEILAWLRAQPSLQDIPVVVLTGSDEARDHRSTSELGAKGYLVKPAEPQQLLDAMKFIATSTGSTI